VVEGTRNGAQEGEEAQVDVTVRARAPQLGESRGLEARCELRVLCRFEAVLVRDVTVRQGERDIVSCPVAGT